MNIIRLKYNLCLFISNFMLCICYNAHSLIIMTCLRDKRKRMFNFYDANRNEWEYHTCHIHVHVRNILTRLKWNKSKKIFLLSTYLLLSLKEWPIWWWWKRTKWNVPSFKEKSLINLPDISYFFAHSIKQMEFFPDYLLLLPLLLLL